MRAIPDGSSTVYPVNAGQVAAGALAISIAAALASAERRDAGPVSRILPKAQRADERGARVLYALLVVPGLVVVGVAGVALLIQGFVQ